MATYLAIAASDELCEISRNGHARFRREAIQLGKLSPGQSHIDSVVASVLRVQGGRPILLFFLIFGLIVPCLFFVAYFVNSFFGLRDKFPESVYAVSNQSSQLDTGDLAILGPGEQGSLADT